MISTKKQLLLLVVVGVFWNADGTSARGLDVSQTVQSSQPDVQVHTGDPNHGFTLQSGYEGYLLSPQKASNAVSVWSEVWSALGKIALVKSSKSLLVLLSSLIHGLKILKVLLPTLGLLGIGALLTIPFCTFTSFCTISLKNSPFSFIKLNAVKEQVAELAHTYMSPEKLEMATRLVKSALETYGSASHNVQNHLSEPVTADLPVTSEHPDEQQNEAHLD